MGLTKARTARDAQSFLCAPLCSLCFPLSLLFRTCERVPYAQGVAITLALVSFFCALLPAALFVVNLSHYREPPLASGPLLAVSILIPARNEARGIADALNAALATTDVTFEVIVMDDGSSDGTAAIVEEFAARDARVRLAHAPLLPTGWNGKQHACWALAQLARNPVLCFVDADVRLAPGCISRMAAFLEGSNSSLVSGFPRQITGTFLEWLLLPLIHFVLLGFLPLASMRKGTEPAMAAGCGQFLMVRAADYFAIGGHPNIRNTMHDGLRLPRLFREHGLRTDLADLTNLATCRMYSNGHDVWSGLAKNATEGLAAPTRIGPVSVILILGQIFPFLPVLFLVYEALTHLRSVLSALIHQTYVIGLSRAGWVIVPAFCMTVVLAYLPRTLGAIRFRQSWRGAILHPLGILILLAIQWYALVRKLRGGPVAWRDRVYAE